MEKEMATHSSILAWRIPWTEEPGGLQSMGSQRVRHDLVTKQQLPTYRSNALFLWGSGKSSWMEKEKGLVHCRRGLSPRLLPRNMLFSETKVMQRNSMAMG